MSPRLELKSLHNNDLHNRRLGVCCRFWTAGDTFGDTRKKRHRNRRDRDWDEFPFKQYFTTIANNSSWPAKSVDRSQYRLKLKLSNWWFHQCQLTLLDFPGERFADAAMMHNDFYEWSHQQLEWLASAAPMHNGQNGMGKLNKVQAYQRLLQADDVKMTTEGAIIDAYKLVLAELTNRWHIYASPSFFILDDRGKTAVELQDELYKQVGPGNIRQDLIIEQVAKGRCSGLRDNEFAPLEKRYWKDSPELVQCFEKRYNEYRKQIVVPIFEQLGRCDGIVMLFDLADALMSGHEQMADLDTFVKQVIDAVRPGGNVFQAMFNCLGWSPRIRRIAVAASQCDRFHPEDREILSSLVEKLCGPHLTSIPGIQSQYFACAAIRSTTFFDGQLSGRICRKGVPPGAAERYEIDRIPEDWADGEHWPQVWDPNQFQIDRVWPEMPKVFNASPSHIDLDAVFRFAAGW